MTWACYHDWIRLLRMKGLCSSPQPLKQSYAFTLLWRDNWKTSQMEMVVPGDRTVRLLIHYLDELLTKY